MSVNDTLGQFGLHVPAHSQAALDKIIKTAEEKINILEKNADELKRQIDYKYQNLEQNLSAKLADVGMNVLEGSMSQLRDNIDRLNYAGYPQTSSSGSGYMYDFHRMHNDIESLKGIVKTLSAVILKYHGKEPGYY